jgi:hypothetical protein
VVSNRLDEPEGDHQKLQNNPYGVWLGGTVQQWLYSELLPLLSHKEIIVSNDGIFRNLCLKIRENWFPIALIFVVLLSYSFGKDRASRDNARDVKYGEFHDLADQKDVFRL